MPKLVFTCDVECHDPERNPQWLLGKSGDKKWLEIIASELGRRNITGTFFLDFTGCENWEDSLHQAVDILIRHKQRVELHIHPANAGWCRVKMLSALSYDDQARLFEEAVQNYRRFVGKEPEIFRAGGYGINQDTLRLLKSYRLMDSSYFIGKSQVMVTPEDYQKLGIAFYPVTVSHFRGLGKYVKHDLNIMPRSILEHQILTNDIMIFMHSFSFNRFKHRYILEKDNPLPVKRFDCILKLIDSLKTTPVDIAQFPNTCFVTEIPFKEMIYNSIYIVMRNHYLLE